MTEEAEKAAKWQLVEDYNKASARLAALENEMKKIAGEWTSLAMVLRSPQGFALDTGGQQIIAGNSQSRQTVAHVPKAHVNWESLVQLISDYQATRKEKTELAAQLRSAGLDLSSYTV